jgi:hypothetical protein
LKPSGAGFLVFLAVLDDDELDELLDLLSFAEKSIEAILIPALFA